MAQQGRIVGIGGIFFKSANQQQMKEWYAKHLERHDAHQIGVYEVIRESAGREVITEHPAVAVSNGPASTRERRTASWLPILSEQHAREIAPAETPAGRSPTIANSRILG